MAEVLIRNGLVVTNGGSARWDVLLTGELITAIKPEIQPPAGAEVIDADGLLVLPGGVDVHTHFGRTEVETGLARVSDGWPAGSRAAAFGGTTAVVEHLGFGPSGPQLRHQLDVYWKSALEAAIDYGFLCVCQHWDDDVAADVSSLITAGLAYSGLLTAGDLSAALKILRETDGLMTVHAENQAVVRFLTDALRIIAPHRADNHPQSRPDYAEALDVETAVRLAEAAGDTPLYFAGLSSARGLAAVRAARREGRRVWAETCPHYLVLTDDHYNGDFDQALKYVTSPPLRKSSDIEALWEGLFDGTISAVATDHCSFAWSEKKARAQGNVFQCPGGLPGVETRLPLLYSEGVVKRGLSVERFVDLVSTAPAHLFGLARKGRLEVGYEADVVVFDPAAEKTLTAETLHQAVDFTPFEDMVVRGWPKFVFLRGHKIVDGEHFLGEPGQGRFVARRPFSEASTINEV